MEKQKDQKQFLIDMTTDLFNQLEKYVRQSGLSRNAFVRKIIISYITEQMLTENNTSSTYGNSIQGSEKTIENKWTFNPTN